MATLGILRLEGESEADFQRRYCREKMRIYRARKPKSDKKRGKGLGPLKNSGMTQEEWEALRQQPGESDTDYNRRYGRAVYDRWKAKDPDKAYQVRRDYRVANRDHLREKAYEWLENNPEKGVAQQRRYFEANRAKRLSALATWGAARPEHVKQVRRAWFAANRGRANAYASKRRALERKATPAWADLDAIRLIYEEAARISEESGIEHHVDHILPLAGKTVSGLHVQNNLRIITATENLKKRNKLFEELCAP